MPYPITQRELTVHLHNKNWYLRPIEDNENILAAGGQFHSWLATASLLLVEFPMGWVLRLQYGRRGIHVSWSGS